MVTFDGSKEFAFRRFQDRLRSRHSALEHLFDLGVTDNLSVPEAEESAQKATSAGALFVELESNLKQVANELGYPRNELRFLGGRHGEGLVPGKVSLQEIIWAASNNFRHYHEWSDERTRQNKDSFGVLDNLRLDFPYDYNACGEILFQLQHDRHLQLTSYSVLEEKVLSIGRSLLKNVSRLV